MTVRAMEHSAAAALVFIGGFYVLLTGAKIVVALIVARSSLLLTGKAYVCIMRGLGAILFVLAGFLIREGIRMVL